MKSVVVLFLFLLYALAPLLSSCSPERILEPHVYRSLSWDTTFSIDGVVFPANSVNELAFTPPADSVRFAVLRSAIMRRDTIRVGAIGGSITEAEGYFSYAERLCSFLENNYPEKTFTLINAGIGATNSRYACSRAEGDLLNHSPDLVIIDFAVNDHPADSAVFEGLVRRCLQNCSGPVILLFTMKNDGDSTVEETESRIGAHYHLPMFSYRKVMVPLLASGDISWNTVAVDIVHPNDCGHLIMGYLLYSGITSILDSVVENDSPDRQLPPPLISGFYEQAGVADTTDSPVAIVECAGWDRQAGDYGRISFSSTDAGATIVLRSSVRELVIGFHCSREYNANLEVTIDSNETLIINNYLENDPGAGYMQLYALYKDTTAAEHAVRFRKSDTGMVEIETLLYVE